MIEAVHKEPCKDAIGWVEKADALLLQCAYDGVISTYIAKKLEKVIEQPENREEEEGGDHEERKQGEAGSNHGSP